MKQLFVSLSLILIATVGLSGCSDDQEIGMTLEGTWEGYMNIYAEYGGRRYQSTDTYISFSTDPFRFTRGDGYWLDRYVGAPWGHDYIASHIQWRVNNQVIYIHFIEDNYDVEIHDYRLSDNFFTGTIYMGGQTVDFRLRHVDSPNWDDYYYGYDYYAKPQSLQMPKQCPMRVLQP